mgnify:CR=1 FL=1
MWIQAFFAACRIVVPSSTSTGCRRLSDVPSCFSSSSPLKSSRVGCSPATVSRIRVIRIIHDIAFTDCCTPFFPSGCFHRFYNLLLLHKFLPHGCLSADRAVIAVDVRQIFLTEVLDARLHRNSGRNVPDHTGSQAHRLRQLIDFSRSGRVASPG